MKKVLCGLGLAGLIFMFNVGAAFAGNQLCPTNKPSNMTQDAYDELKRSEVCANQADTIAGPDGLISDITNIVSIVAGIAAVVMIMVGGFKFVTSAGDSGKIEEAKKTITWSVVGLVVIVLARTIILFVISKV